jgi:hypothetical protein
MALLKLEPQLANSSANFTFGNVLASNFYYANGTLYSTGGTPSGSNTQIQFNNSGNFGASGNLTFNSATNVMTVTGNVSATYFIGNGSQLTGLPAGYANSNVAAYLPTYTGNISAGNISVTSNISAANLSTTGTITFSTASNVTLGSNANVHITGGTSGQYLQTDGSGNLSWAAVSGGGGGGGGTYVTRKYTATGTGNTYTVTSGCGVDNVLVFVNGICQAPTDDYTISTTTLTLDGMPVSGTKIHIRELPR